MATKKQAVKKVAAGKLEKQSTKAAPVETGTLQVLPLEKVLPTKDNKRQIDPKSPAIAELAESIKASGQIQPVLVRPHPSKKGFYDLRAGERRLVACQVAGLKTIAAIVQDLDDTAAKRVTVLENLQREDLKPLEESAAVGELVATGQSLREIAAQVGKSHQWVARRAKLVDLTPAWRTVFEKHNAPATAMELVARYRREEQDRLFKTLEKDRHSISWALEESRDPTQALAEELQGLTRCLDGAPWKKDAVGLVSATGAGAAASCKDCPNRTGARADEGLFDSDCCLDPTCYDGKLAAYLEAQEKTLRAEHANLVLVDKGGGGGRDCPKGTLRSWQYEASKPGAKGAVPALVVQGAGLGKLEWVKVDHEQPDLAAQEAAGPKSLKRKQAELESKRWAQTIERFRKVLAETPMTNLEGGHRDAIMLAATFGTGVDVDGEWENYEAFVKLDSTRQLPAAAEVLWEHTREVIAKALVYWGPVTQYPLEHVDGARPIAKLIGFDLDGLYMTVCQEKGFTVPKSWGDGATE